MTKTTKQIIGKWGEEQARLFLIGKDYKIIDRNYEIRKMGKKIAEIDIIAKHTKYHHGETLCFIEVKTRTYIQPDNLENNAAENAASGRKMRKFLLAARHYCADKNIDIDRIPIQFEQISIYLRRQNKKIILRHYVIQTRLCDSL